MATFKGAHPNHYPKPEGEIQISPDTPLLVGRWAASLRCRHCAIWAASAGRPPGFRLS